MTFFKRFLNIIPECLLRTVFRDIMAAYLWAYLQLVRDGIAPMTQGL